MSGRGAGGHRGHMAETALAHAAGRTTVPRAAVSVPGYAVVRLAALVPAAEQPVPARYRVLAGRQVELLVRCARLAGPLADALYGCAGTVPAEFRRRVVLPLRRDVHNLRSPRPALRAALGDLPARLDLLRCWLDARDDLDRVAAEVLALTPDALRAEREALADACRCEPLRRAVALTGEDLLRAVD